MAKLDRLMADLDPDAAERVIAWLRDKYGPPVKHGTNPEWAG